APRFTRSILLGIVFGLTVLTKTNALLFLIGPALVEAVYALLRRDRKRLLQLCLVGLISALVILPWIVLAGSAVTAYINSIQAQNLTMQDKHIPLLDFFQNLGTFLLPDLVSILTPLLYGCLLIAFITGKRNLDRNKLYLIASATCGIILA